MAATIFSFRVVLGRRRPQQGRQPPPTTTTTTTTDNNHQTRARTPSPSPSTADLELGRRPGSDPESARREPQATQSQVDGVTAGREGSDTGPSFFQVEVAPIPEGGWEASLRAGSGPRWLWWSVVVVVVLLLWSWAMASALRRG